MGAHSIHGMSGQSITIACPGSIGMSKGIVEEGDQTASDKGTAVHDAGEFAFHTGALGSDLYGMKFNGHKITKSMAEAVDIYANQLREYDRPVTVKSYVEKKVSISSIDPKRLWGTGDYVGIDYINRKLIVADYKNGYVTVEIDKDQYVYALDQYIKGNAQVIGYALGAMDLFNLWGKVDSVETCIIQPNKPHEDGPIRKTVYTMDEMKAWWNVYKVSHELAVQDNAPKIAGKHCKYCKARGFCSTRIVDTMTKIQLDTGFDKVKPEQLIAIFEHADTMISSLKQLKEEVVSLSRQGYKIPEHKLVKAWKRANILDEEAFVSEAIQLGKTVDDLYNRELKSKTDIKGLLGEKFAHKHFKTPDAGLKLVPLTDAGTAQRPDRMSSAVGKFTAIK